MLPLQQIFHKLPPEALNLVNEIVVNAENPLSCEVCNQDVFDTDCNTCPFKNRRVRDLLIESHIPLVKNIAQTLSERRDYEEVLSVGMLALTKAVDKFPTLLPDSNLGGYVRVSVTLGIKQFILTNTVIKVPAYANRSYYALRVTYSMATSNLANSHGEYDQERDEPSVMSSELQVDLDEILTTLPESVYDGIILSCLIKGGYTGREIADMCGVTSSHVSALKKKLVRKIYKNLVEN